ncbi:hypothetical protein SCA6_008510 [Theobroma cacao]
MEMHNESGLFRKGKKEKFQTNGVLTSIKQFRFRRACDPIYGKFELELTDPFYYSGANGLRDTFYTSGSLRVFAH